MTQIAQSVQRPEKLANPPKILVIDNYDSFTFNLVHYLMELGAEVLVERNDALSVAQIMRSDAQGYLISPGPCTPDQAGVSLELAAACVDASAPMLGVCLGHQVIGQHFGGKVVQGGLMHGKTSQIDHDSSGVFADLNNPFLATRYHSLIVENVGEELITNATTTDHASGAKYAMGFRHQTRPIHGVQFHPESIASECGHALLANFLRMCGGPKQASRSTEASESTEASKSSEANVASAASTS